MSVIGYLEGFVESHLAGGAWIETGYSDDNIEFEGVAPRMRCVDNTSSYNAFWGVFYFVQIYVTYNFLSYIT